MKRLKSKKLALFAIFVLTFDYLNIRPPKKLPENKKINLTMIKTDKKIVIEANRVDKSKFSSANIFLNDNLFFRAYEKDSQKMQKGVVTFIFDDGWLDVFDQAYPIFSEYHFPATVATIASYVDKAQALSSRQIRRLIKDGWDIVSHSVGDKSLLELDYGKQEYELKESRNYFWKRNLWATRYFIYPSGEVDDNLQELTRKYYEVGRGYEEGLNEIPIDPFNIKIISLEKDTIVEDLKDIVDRLDHERLWAVFVGHHASDEDEGEYNLHTADLDDILDYIEKKGLEVFTFGRAIQELNEDLSLIKNSKLTWEFEREQLSPGYYKIEVEIEGDKSSALRFHN